MATGIKIGYPCGFNKGHSSKFRVGSRVQQTPEEGWRIYQPKRCGNNNKYEDNSPKALNDKNIWKSQNIFYKRIKIWKKLLSKENDTHDLTPVCKDQKVIVNRWIYALKLGPNNKEQFMAEYIAKGFSQLENLDPQDRFSPTAEITSIRMLM